MDFDKKSEAPDYVGWLSVFKTNDKAPKWKKLNFVIDTNQMQEMMNNIKSKGTKDGKVRFDLCQSSKGNIYLAYDTYHRDRENEQKVKASDHSPDREEMSFLDG